MQHLSRNRCAEENDQQKEEKVMRHDDYSNTQLQRAIDEWIHSERDRKIMKRRLIDGICFEPLAEEFDMSVTQIKRIVYKHEMKIYSHI